MRPLTDDEIDEIESLGHLIKYTNMKPDIKDFEIWHCMKEMEAVGKKYVLSGIAKEEEINILINLDDMKDLVEKFFKNLEKAFEK